MPRSLCRPCARAHVPGGKFGSVGRGEGKARKGWGWVGGGGYTAALYGTQLSRHPSTSHSHTAVLRHGHSALSVCTGRGYHTDRPTHGSAAALVVVRRLVPRYVISPSPLLCRRPFNKALLKAQCRPGCWAFVRVVVGLLQSFVSVVLV